LLDVPVLIQDAFIQFHAGISDPLFLAGCVFAAGFPVCMIILWHAQSQKNKPSV
jgi:hypothetical protein